MSLTMPIAPILDSYGEGLLTRSEMLSLMVDAIDTRRYSHEVRAHNLTTPIEQIIVEVDSADHLLNIMRYLTYEWETVRWAENLILALRAMTGRATI